MSSMRHLASPIAKSFSEALRIDTEAGSWIFIAGQVGVAIPTNNQSISFEQEVRLTSIGSGNPCASSMLTWTRS